MMKKNLWENINYLKKKDEVKFVIEDANDYKWAKEKIIQYNLLEKCNILMSPSYNKIKPEQITKWILNDNLDIRFQIQLHKEIWGNVERGV